MLHRPREHEKVPAGVGEFCLRALCTKLSRIFLLRRKEMRGLSVKMADVSGSFLSILKLRLTISLTLKLKG